MLAPPSRAFDARGGDPETDRFGCRVVRWRRVGGTRSEKTCECARARAPSVDIVRLSARSSLIHAPKSVEQGPIMVEHGSMPAQTRHNLADATPLWVEHGGGRNGPRPTRPDSGRARWGFGRARPNIRRQKSRFGRTPPIFGRSPNLSPWAKLRYIWFRLA